MTIEPELLMILMVLELLELLMVLELLDLDLEAGSWSPIFERRGPEALWRAWRRLDLAFLAWGA